jgi:hypothetical protein
LISLTFVKITRLKKDSLASVMTLLVLFNSSLVRINQNLRVNFARTALVFSLSYSWLRVTIAFLAACRVEGFVRKGAYFFFSFSETFLVLRVFKELIINLVPMFKNVAFYLINFLVNILVLLSGKALLIRF